MKKYIIAFMILILFSFCEKIERCEVCVTTSYIESDPLDFIEGQPFIACDKDLKVWDGRVMRVVKEDNAGYTLISITRCN